MISTAYSYPVMRLRRFKVGLDETEWLLAVDFLGEEHLALQGPAQDNDSPGSVPSCQFKLAILAFPALAGIGPASFTEKPFDMALDVLRELELEE